MQHAGNVRIKPSKTASVTKSSKTLNVKKITKTVTATLIKD